MGHGVPYQKRGRQFNLTQFLVGEKWKGQINGKIMTAYSSCMRNNNWTTIYLNYLVEEEKEVSLGDIP